MTRELLEQWIKIQRRVAVAARPGAEHEAPVWSPNTDVYERADEVVVRMEVAGVADEDIAISLQDRALRVSGVRRDPCCDQTAAGFRLRQMEIDHGPFERLVALPFSADGARATATCRHGILEIRLPRRAAAAARRIRIEVAS